MLKQENLAANFCGLLTRHYNYRKTAVEWRILGQEQDGSMLASWISLSMNETPIERTHIGLYNPVEKLFQILHSFDKRENCIQASVNTSRTLLTYVLKESRSRDGESQTDYVYLPFIVEIKAENDAPSKCERAMLLPEGSSKQVMAQFLWQKKSIFEKTFEVKLLLFIHDDCITMLKTKLTKVAGDTAGGQIDLKNFDTWKLDTESITREVIVKHFIWAQWDSVTQALYYIHLKPTVKSSLEKDDDKSKETDTSTTTTLSAHQFHENLPRETVVGSKGNSVQSMYFSYVFVFCFSFYFYFF